MGWVRPWALEPDGLGQRPDFTTSQLCNFIQIPVVPMQMKNGRSWGESRYHDPLVSFDV